VAVDMLNAERCRGAMSRVAASWLCCRRRQQHHSQPARFVMMINRDLSTLHFSRNAPSS